MSLDDAHVSLQQVQLLLQALPARPLERRVSQQRQALVAPVRQRPVAPQPGQDGAARRVGEAQGLPAIARRGAVVLPLALLLLALALVALQVRRQATEALESIVVVVAILSHCCLLCCNVFIAVIVVLLMIAVVFQYFPHTCNYFLFSVLCRIFLI